MKYIDLFAGIGGFRLALDDLGLSCVLSSEIDNACQDVYELNFGERPSGDICSIDSKSIPSFDILVGGFPCQPFSYAGKKLGFNDKKDGQLFFEILRILRDKRPKMFLLENVKGIRSIEKGKTVKNILTALRDIGYKVYDDVLDSNHFGLPQYRERWFCAGFDKDIHFQFPIGDNSSVKLKSIIDEHDDNPALVLSDREIELIKFHFSSSDIRVKHENTLNAGPNSKIGKYGVYSYLKPDNTLRFHVGDPAKSQIQDYYYASLDSVAPAIIVTREPKLWDIKRKLSLLECQRLQGFPDDFKFVGSDRKGKKQLGNAVSVPVVREVLRNMLDYYAESIPSLQ